MRASKGMRFQQHCRLVLAEFRTCYISPSSLLWLINANRNRTLILNRKKRKEKKKKRGGRKKENRKILFKPCYSKMEGNHLLGAFQ
jgi:hypothetical protein